MVDTFDNDDDHLFQESKCLNNNDELTTQKLQAILSPNQEDFRKYSLHGKSINENNPIDNCDQKREITSSPLNSNKIKSYFTKSNFNQMNQGGEIGNLHKSIDIKLFDC